MDSFNFISKNSFSIDEEISDFVITDFPNDFIWACCSRGVGNMSIDVLAELSVVVDEDFFVDSTDTLVDSIGKTLDWFGTMVDSIGGIVDFAGTVLNETNAGFIRFADATVVDLPDATVVDFTESTVVDCIGRIIDFTGILVDFNGLVIGFLVWKLCVSIFGRFSVVDLINLSWLFFSLAINSDSSLLKLTILRF